jgi:WhiB family transcriptional regulator, redox-sensing transcriptional regulator
MSWKELGICREMDPAVFFPDHDRWAEERAKAICVDCPVRAQCMDYAIVNRELGIWGGTTERDRRRIEDRYVRTRRILAIRKALAELQVSV